MNANNGGKELLQNVWPVKACILKAVMVELAVQILCYLRIQSAVFFLQDESNKIKKEATDLDKLIDKTEKEYNDLRDDLKGKEVEVRKLLEKGKTEQQVGKL